MFKRITMEDIDQIAEGYDQTVPCLCGLLNGEKTQKCKVEVLGSRFDRVKVSCRECGRYTIGDSLFKANLKWSNGRCRCPESMFGRLSRYLEGKDNERKIDMMFSGIIGMLIGGALFMGCFLFL